MWCDQLLDRVSRTWLDDDIIVRWHMYWHARLFWSRKCRFLGALFVCLKQCLFCVFAWHRSESVAFLYFSFMRKQLLTRIPKCVSALPIYISSADTISINRQRENILAHATVTPLSASDDDVFNMHWCLEKRNVCGPELPRRPRNSIHWLSWLKLTQ